MFTHVAGGDRIKLYLDGGADITGTFEGFVDHAGNRSFGPTSVVSVTAPNGKRIRVRSEAVVAVVEL